MITGWGEEGGAPDKRGGKGQPPLQLMPCSGEEEGEEGEEGRKYKGRKGIFQVEEEERLGPSDRERERVSSGRCRRRKEQWPIDRRGNCLAKAIQHKQENSPSVEAEDGWWTPEVGAGGTLWQSHRPTSWAGRRKVLWSLFFFFFSSSSSSHVRAVLGCFLPPSSPSYAPLPPEPPLHR